jgi:hypothetical protein
MLNTGNDDLFKKDASYSAGRFRMKGFPANAVAFRSVNYPTKYLSHNYYEDNQGHGAIHINNFNMKNVTRFAKRATWFYIKEKC